MAYGKKSFSPPAGVRPTPSVVGLKSKKRQKKYSSFQKICIFAVVK
jgi:hypothetical protein